MKKENGVAVAVIRTVSRDTCPECESIPQGPQVLSFPTNKKAYNKWLSEAISFGTESSPDV